ncbi:MAG: Crp/Fnr family transcriptional regulator [Bacteroidales bacterium]|nr:Crp/Fnr family transcriptional regulator [Bacteroidales bacterium]
MSNYFQDPNCKDCLGVEKGFFKNLNPDELEFLNNKKSCSSYQKGAVLYRENQRINGVFCINSGVVKVFKTGVSGKEQIIKFLKSGDIFGYRSIMNGEPACTSAKVHIDASICYIPSSDFFTLLRKNNDLAIELLQLACTELGEANKFITDMAQKTVKERLAEILLFLKEEYGIDDEEMLSINLTREELANLIGTATESVIRLLSEFKSEGFLELKARKIRILDEANLKKIANL